MPPPFPDGTCSTRERRARDRTPAARPRPPRPLPGRGRARPPTDDRGREPPLPAPVPTAAPRADEQCPRPPAQLVPWLAHRRQRDGGRGGEVDVVVADDREVAGHGDAVAHH